MIQIHFLGWGYQDFSRHAAEERRVQNRRLKRQFWGTMIQKLELINLILIFSLPWVLFNFQIFVTLSLICNFIFNIAQFYHVSIKYLVHWTI